MTRKTIGLAAAALAVAVGAAGWKAYDAFVAQRRDAEKALGIIRVDAPAPPLDLATVGGGQLRSDALRGKFLLVNFWATWCPPCVAEMPDMLAFGRAMEQRHPGRFRMVAISEDDDWEHLLAYFVATGGPPPVTTAFDAQGTARAAYYCAVRPGQECARPFARDEIFDLVLPETFLIEPSGRIVGHFIGRRDWNDPAIQGYIERLVGS